MKIEDMVKARELAQEDKETRYLMAEVEHDLRAARADAKTFSQDVANGKPGARLDLEEATKRVAELEARAKGLEERHLSLSTEAGALGKWDMQARSLARAHRLDDDQMEALFEELKAGKSREEVEKTARRFNKAEVPSERSYTPLPATVETATIATPQAAPLVFQRADDVAW